MGDILVIKSEALIHPEKLFEERNKILSQMKDKVVVLPYYMSAQVVPEDIVLAMQNADGKIILVDEL